MTNKTPLTRETLNELPNLKYIGMLATGYNVVDVEAAAELKIPVTNIPEYGTKSVAQMVFALLLELTQHVGHHSQTVIAGQWGKSKNCIITPHISWATKAARERLMKTAVKNIECYLANSPQNVVNF